MNRAASITIPLPLLFMGVGVLMVLWALTGKNPDASYSEKLAELEQIQASLKSFDRFIQDETERLKQSEAIAEQLRSQHEQLQPVVESEQKVVDAILQLQEERTRANVWWDRLLGVVVGLGCSVIGNWIWMGLQTRRQRRDVGSVVKSIAGEAKPEEQTFPGNNLPEEKGG